MFSLSRFGLYVTFILLALSFHSEAGVSKKRWLEQGQSEFRELVIGDNHTYQLKVAKGQFIAGEAIQKNIDISISIFNPNGAQVASFDQFNHNKEPFHFETQHSGVYQVQVNPITKVKGLYSIGLVYSAPIANSPEDKMRQMMVHYASDEPGGVIAVFQGGEIIFSHNYGLANVEYDIPIDVTTAFQLASGSKPFTAFAIAMLEEQKKLSLDDDIRMHLTWMPDFGEVITLRNLLNHTSGLKDAWNLWEMSGGRHDGILNQQQILELIKNQTQLNFKPGERFQYNNGGYALLAEVVSVVTNQKFSQWMAQNIFQPLGMNSTYVLDDHQLIIKQRAYSYTSKYLGIKNAILNKSYIGAANVYSTANDLSLWINNLHTARVGGQKVINNMQQQGVLNNGKVLNYALGFYIKQYKGLKQIIQGGSTAAFRTMINYYPKINASVIVMANTPDFNARTIAHKTAEIFFAAAMQSENKTVIQTQIPGANSKKHGVIPLEEIILNQQKLKSINDYIGTYYSEELMTTYKVVLENKLLVLKYHRGVFPFNPNGKDKFGLNDDWQFDWSFNFERDDQNRVKHLRLDSLRAQNVQFKKLKESQ